MDEVAEAIEKYKGLVPLVYDIETMGLVEARPQDMYYAVYLKREADKEFAKLKRALWLARAQRANEHYHRYHGKFLCPLEDIPEYVKWKQVERKCRAKAELYK